MAEDEVHDSPVGWVNKHITAYLASGGKQRKGGRPMLLLTTRGRRSGELRRTALNYWTDDDRFVVIGSNGGAVKHPSWYLNLTADPQVRLQVGAEEFDAVAREATEQERPRLWAQVAADMPDYDGFQRKTSRQIPVIVLERT